VACCEDGDWGLGYGFCGLRCEFEGLKVEIEV